MPISKKQKEKIIPILINGGVGVVATDTIYGLVGSALMPKTVRRIYKLRRREKKKPMIILINSLDDLKLFGIRTGIRQKRILKKLWPGKVSVILPCRSKKFAYLHRSAKTLAFRLPAKKELRQLLEITGPLVAPSANLQGFNPASTIRQARKYFKNKINFYVNGGYLSSSPSTLVEIKGSRLIVRRTGAVKIPKGIGK
jgi:L-threonylcarbamoyladenylate synthase